MNNNIKVPLRNGTIFFCKLDDFIAEIKKCPRISLGELECKNTFEYFDSFFKEEVYSAESNDIVFSPVSCPNITLFTSNLSDGGSSLVYIMNKFLKLDSISLRISKAEDFYKIYAFDYYKDGDSIRYVRSMQDPRWEFYEEGTSLWFEDIELYKQRMIKKRMNKDILIDYCNKLGFNIDDKCFWQNSGSIYELT